MCTSLARSCMPTLADPRWDLGAHARTPVCERTCAVHTRKKTVHVTPPVHVCTHTTQDVLVHPVYVCTTVVCMYAVCNPTGAHACVNKTVHAEPRPLTHTSTQDTPCMQPPIHGANMVHTPEKNPCTQTVQAQDACTCKHRPRVRGRMHVQACTGRMQVALQFTHAAVWQLP